MSSPLHTRLGELKRIAEAATPANGKILHTAPAGTCRDEIAKALLESLDRSIAHNPDIGWWWVETHDGLKIAEFGSGPTSEANAEAWAASRTELPRLIEALEISLKAFEQRSTHTYYCDVVPPSAPGTCDACDAKAEITALFANPPASKKGGGE